jgi:hypothetical protein
MTDVEIAERTIASLQDQRDRATIHAGDITVERQVLAYAAFAGGDGKAKDKLAALNRSAHEVAMTIEALDAALIEARQRLTSAQAAVARDVAAESRAKACGILAELVKVATTLDTTMEHPDGTGPVFVSNPPACQRAGTLIGALFVELRALQITQVAWPPARWDVGGRPDLKRELMRVLREGWGYNPGVHRAPVTIGRRVIEGPFFAELFAYWEKRLDSAIREQTKDAA